MLITQVAQAQDLAMVPTYERVDIDTLRTKALRQNSNLESI